MKLSESLANLSKRIEQVEASGIDFSRQSIDVHVNSLDHATVAAALLGLEERRDGAIHSWHKGSVGDIEVTVHGPHIKTAVSA